MPRGPTAATRNPTQVSAGKKSDPRIDWIGMITNEAAALAAFMTLSTNQFVNWDDPYALSGNKQLGSPGILEWAFTTRLMGHFQPVAWLTWSAVNSLAGTSPIAFHTLSLIGHIVNAMLVYLVTRRLLKSSPEHGSSSVAAAAVALLFAVHPMRVEPVAWASAFPYVQSLTWLLMATL